MIAKLLRAVSCCALLALAGCVTTDASGRSYLHHFGYARILIDPGDDTHADTGDGFADRNPAAKAADIARGELRDTQLFGFWLGREIGLGYRHQIRATTPSGCHLAVHARNEQQLERFITVMKTTGLTGDNVCVVPYSL